MIEPKRNGNLREEKKITLTFETRVIHAVFVLSVVCVLGLLLVCNLNPDSVLLKENALLRNVPLAKSINETAVTAFGLLFTLMHFRLLKALLLTSISLGLATFFTFVSLIDIRLPLWSMLRRPVLFILDFSPFKSTSLYLFLSILAFAASVWLVSKASVKCVQLVFAIQGRLAQTYLKIANKRAENPSYGSWVSRAAQISIFLAAIGQVVYLSMIYHSRQAKRLAASEINTVSTESTSSKSPPKQTWSYDNQKAWPIDYEGCKNKFAQSPIDISYESLRVDQSAVFPGNSIEFNVHVFENLGVTLLPNSDSVITLAQKDFKLTSIKLKSPSEHKRNGISYPLEIQIYLKNSEAKLAAISQVFTIGEANPDLQKIVAGIVSPKDEKRVLLKLENVLSQSPNRNAAYHGSLPFPPCEHMAWLHFEEVKSLSWSQFKYFSQLLGRNRRNIQPSSTDIAKANSY